MHEQIAVSAGDLRFLTVLCRHCNTSVTLDLDAEIEPGIVYQSNNPEIQKWHAALLHNAQPSGGRSVSPRECPRCNNSFDSVIPGAIDTMQKVFKALAKFGNAVTFAVPAPTAQDSEEGK